MLKKIIFEKNGRNENFGFLPDFGEKSIFFQKKIFEDRSTE